MISANIHKKEKTMRHQEQNTPGVKVPQQEKVNKNADVRPGTPAYGADKKEGGIRKDRDFSTSKEGSEEDREDDKGSCGTC